MIMIYVTLNNAQEASKIGRDILENKLANCVNFFPITCIYNYENEITEELETGLGRMVICRLSENNPSRARRDEHDPRLSPCDK